MKLSDREWKDFAVPYVFQNIQRGKRLKNADHVPGIIPYVSSTANNNGVDDYIEATKGTRVFKNCISLANSGSVGTAFYEPFAFVASDHVTSLKCDNANEYIYLFLTAVLEQQSSNFNFNREINDLRIKKMRIMLPVTDDGEPDYQFMEDYMRELMIAKRKQYRDFVEKRLTELGVDVKIIGGGYRESLDSREWKAIPIVKLFNRIEPGRGKGLNHLNLAEHGVSYIGATNRNNGVMCFVKDDIASRKITQEGNCIGFIKNGDGSAGFAIYKKESFVSTSDVIYGYADWLNEYTGLFFVAAQDLIEKKYSHGYKRNQQHLRGDRVMLPVTETGEPDYEFMEEFGRKMMTNKYSQYLAFLALSDTIKEMKN